MPPVRLTNQGAGGLEGWAVQLGARSRKDLLHARKLRGFRLGSRGEIQATKHAGGLPGAGRVVQVGPRLCGASFMFPALCLSRRYLTAFQQVPPVLTVSKNNAVYLCTIIRVWRPDVKHQSIGPNLQWVLSP